MDPAADAPGNTPHDCKQVLLLWRLVDDDELDAALEAGLMAFMPCGGCDAATVADLLVARQRLATAWAARARYLARNVRLARLAAARDTGRAIPRVEKETRLPPSVAAVLARAKAKASERGAG